MRGVSPGSHLQLQNTDSRNFGLSSSTDLHHIASAPITTVQKKRGNGKKLDTSPLKSNPPSPLSFIAPFVSGRTQVNDSHVCRVDSPERSRYY